MTLAVFARFLPYNISVYIVLDNTSRPNWKVGPLPTRSAPGAFIKNSRKVSQKISAPTTTAVEGTYGNWVWIGLTVIGVIDNPSDWPCILLWLRIFLIISLFEIVIMAWIKQCELIGSVQRNPLLDETFHNINFYNKDYTLKMQYSCV